MSQPELTFHPFPVPMGTFSRTPFLWQGGGMRVGGVTFYAIYREDFLNANIGVKEEKKMLGVL